MKFFGKTKIDFIGKRRIAFAISLVIILAGIVSLVINKGPKYSIDFTGGVAMELDLTPVKDGAEIVKVQEIRDALTNAGIEDAEIQEIKGSDGKQLILIKTQAVGDMKDKTSTKVIDVIKQKFPNNVDLDTLIRLQEEVGPKIGDELKGKAILAIFWALLGIILYIWWRFELTFGLAAVAALFHDILITVGIFSLLGKEISLSIVAALLTIVGYSLNDTIVVFDRIREDLKLYRKESYGSVINHSINETLSRTIITSLTTFVVVLSLYIFGGTVIHDFAFAILVGVVVGTYSSIFVASPLMVEHFNKKEKKMGTRNKKK
ncbi:MAG: protein translocase subunit SecF [Candidatus Cloacimonetes bacterium]|jgi:preprotein translocase SecF subunit|nr:protein translocase subunit SecF [Candidatus Cloacimonadota bacterium]MBT4333384.1 protein translocase subunit SecF [Candidatus Cloacimonadota bacterium]MBT4574853.1 protein translocase subunit SecF [Candidatus Cloacimonadota bacterium]MBT5420898.1 protein translocase subunit SecF [Candidatus Cloacimonadota bacterium]